MSLRPPRTIIAFGVAFVCALAVFTLPRFVWNTVQGAVRQQPTADTTHQAPPAAVPQAPEAPPRSFPQRITGIFGIALILGIGIALSRNRSAISWRVVAWGVGLQLAQGGAARIGTALRLRSPLDEHPLGRLRVVSTDVLDAQKRDRAYRRAVVGAKRLPAQRRAVSRSARS